MSVPVLMSGELGLISLFDLGQLLMLNGATGELVILRESRRGYLYFDRGQVVNAVDDEYREGEGAAFNLFSWRVGAYEFRPQPPSGPQTITGGTEGLMMEAARRIDEAGARSGEAVDKLTRRAGALDELREAFQSVAAQSVPVPEAGPDTGGSPFALLRGSSDALLLRPGHVPRVQSAGRWRSAGTQVVDQAAFEQLRARLLDGARSPGGEAARSLGVQTCLVTHEDGRRYAVTGVSGAQEALWVRAAELAPLEVGALEGPVDALQSVLGSRGGLVIVGGPDAESADRLFHACVALLARARSATVLLVADHGRWRHRDESGALVCAGALDAPELQRALSPDVAAFDTAHAAGSLAALHGSPLVVAAVVALDAEALVTRWCARVGQRWGEGPDALLASATLGLVYTPGSAGEDGRLPFVAEQRTFGTVRTSSGPAVAAASSSGHANPSQQQDTPLDTMAELAAELGRTLRQAA